MSGVLRVLIVDDARLARQELRTLLSALPWVQCVGEADDVPAAREAIATLAPDLVLLDVQMPSGSGFDVLDGLEAVPAVVFVTAYDTYAVRAFQANALDYLVKPVEAPRLLEALQRARQREVVAGETPEPRSTLGAQDQVFVREGERCWFVAVSEIRRLVVDGNYTAMVPRPERPAAPQPERAGSTPAAGVVLPRQPQHAGQPAPHSWRDAQHCRWLRSGAGRRQRGGGIAAAGT